MRDEEKSQVQLLAELRDLRQRVLQLSAPRAETLQHTVEESKDRYRNLFENAVEGILILDVEDQQVQFANEAAAQLFGHELHHLRHLALPNLQLPDDLAATQRLFMEMTDGDRTEATNVPCLSGEGTIFYVDITATVGIVGGRECLILFLRDVTERKQAWDDVLSIINRLGRVSALTDEEGQLTFLSEEGLRLFQLTPEEALGRPWHVAFPLSDEDRRRLAAMRTTPEAQRTPLKLELVLPDGGRYWMEAIVVDHPRDARRTVFFLEDVTELHELRQRLGEASRFHDMIGRCDGMQQVFQRIREVAGVDWTVLIHGETGAGKELVARAIHADSPRRGEPFVAVNCAGLSDALLSSQLFGHRKGAFTGATGDQQGVFEAAHGGTLFLDEIGDISPAVQTSLLRVLEAKEITRVGESRPRAVDVRVIAATHQDLTAEVAAGRFRSDLLYRIRIARVDLPALRERREDIPLLVGEFLRTSAAATNKAVDEISEDAIRALMQYPWPGNVRELRSAVEFAVLHCDGTCVRAADLPPELSAAPAVGTDPAQSLPSDPWGADERGRILDALRRSRGKRAAAARLMGISRATFYRRLDDLGISTDEI
jgi:PAS domain S-box-containing protein